MIGFNLQGITEYKWEINNHNCCKSWLWRYPPRSRGQMKRIMEEKINMIRTIYIPINNGNIIHYTMYERPLVI